MKKQKNNSVKRSSSEKKDSNPDITIISNMQYALNTINFWIGNADQKIEVSCAIFSVVFGIISFVLDNILHQIINADSSNISGNIFAILYILAIISFFVSFIIHIIALIPRFYSFKSTKNQSKINALFYRDIASLTTNDAKYEVLLRSYSSEHLKNDLVEEIYSNSLICDKKMRIFKIGVILGIISLFVCFFLFIYCIASVKFNWSQVKIWFG